MSMTWKNSTTLGVIEIKQNSTKIDKMRPRKYRSSICEVNLSDKYVVALYYFENFI